MSTKSKFDVIMEGQMRRYQGTSFLVGDHVKLIDGYLRHDWIKQQAEGKVLRLKSMVESGDNLRVSAVKALRPAVAQTGHFQEVDDFYVDIIREKAPGLFLPEELVTIPENLLELANDGDWTNLPEIPDNQRREDNSNIKPEESDSAPDNALGDQQLLGQNLDISVAPPARSYTAKYLDS